MIMALAVQWVALLRSVRKEYQEKLDAKADIDFVNQVAEAINIDFGNKFHFIKEKIHDNNVIMKDYLEEFKSSLEYLTKRLDEHIDNTKN